ncbi:hypothetical protein EG327_000405, partial [Venturia inaequalis]
MTPAALVPFYRAMIVYCVYPYLTTHFCLERPTGLSGPRFDSTADMNRLIVTHPTSYRRPTSAASEPTI